MPTDASRCEVVRREEREELYARTHPAVATQVAVPHRKAGVMSVTVKTKSIPLSKAKTAYGLISDVIRAVLEEPKRVDMGCFISAVPPSDGGPACGTIGCFAGWVSLLKGGTSGDRAEGHAVALLGDDLNYHTGPNSDYVFSTGDIDIKGRPGTLTYARSVANRIRKFQTVNRTALKAKKF